MSGLPLSPNDPEISIHSDHSNDQIPPEPKALSERTCLACNTSSGDSLIHCISTSSLNPPCYNSISPSVGSPRNLSVPILSLQTTLGHDNKPLPPDPTLQFDPKSRRSVRFRRNAFSPLSPSIPKHETINWYRKYHVGLAVPQAQSKPDASPITPGTLEKEAGNRMDLAHCIEDNLWKYNASGNAVKRWLLEIVSWLLSAACMASIIIMLIVYKDKSIPKWPLGLTLNGYISIFSKTASAALLLPISEALGQLKWSWFYGDTSRKMWDFELFDNASRGPWGSFLLILRIKGRSLAALGAAVTILSLALDPFFQQVVEYPEGWRPQKGTGSIPRATSYVPYVAGKEYYVGLENVEFDQNMIGPTHHFFYDNGTSIPTTIDGGMQAQIPLECPSKNCTWPEYETLAVCNKCVEASSQLEFKCLYTTLDWVQSPLIDEEGDMVYSNGTSCGWYLKADGSLLMTGYNVDQETPFTDEVLLTRVQPMYGVETKEFLGGYSPLLDYTRNPISHNIIVSGGGRDNILRNATPIAHECLISWCAKTMLSSYSEGRYYESILHTTTNNTMGSSPWKAQAISIESVEGYFYEYTENVTIIGKSGYEFKVLNTSHSMTLLLFDEVFPSTYTLANSTNENDARLRYRFYKVTEPFTRSLTFNPFMYENVSIHLDNLATVMTNIIRSQHNQIERLSGETFDLESFVEVRWQWLTLPLTLLALTFIFLVATIIRSSIEQDHVGVWKTSAIPTLLFGLSDAMQTRIDHSRDIGAAREKTKDVKIKWLPKTGWRMSGDCSSPGLSTNTTPSTSFFRDSTPSIKITTTSDTSLPTISDYSSTTTSDTCSKLKHSPPPRNE